MSVDQMAPRVDVAYHEAGHAVACYVLRRPMERVSIVPKGRTLGYCQPSLWRRSALGLRLEALAFARDGLDLAAALTRSSRAYEIHAQARTYASAITALAGELAAARVTGRYNDVCASGDLAQARALLASISDDLDELREAWQDALTRAQAIVRDYWPAVEAVAAALLRRRELTGVEAGEIVARVLAEDRGWR
jgi:ATP-dependent Zn protease